MISKVLNVTPHLTFRVNLFLEVNQTSWTIIWISNLKQKEK